MLAPDFRSPDRPVVVIMGPTGAGKSDLALRVAGEFDGDILGCDSLQIYRHFDIGTAKLPPEARRGVPHHLIDILEPHEIFTAGEYARRARQILQEVSARGRLPVVVGGTGFYLRAFLDGLVPIPTRDVNLRAKLTRRAARRPGCLHRILERLDPAAAGRIHPNDHQKLVRALEVCLLTRRPLSLLYGGPRDALRGYRPVKIGLNPDRQSLRQVLDERARRMFRCGLLDEVRRLLALGCTGQEKPFESLGYQQALAALRGEMTEAEAIASLQLKTRQYAKRQMTWFRRERDVHWLPGFGHHFEIEQQVLDLLRRLL